MKDWENAYRVIILGIVTFCECVYECIHVQNYHYHLWNVSIDGEWRTKHDPGNKQSLNRYILLFCSVDNHNWSMAIFSYRYDILFYFRYIQKTSIQR